MIRMNEKQQVYLNSWKNQIRGMLHYCPGVVGAVSFVPHCETEIELVILGPDNQQAGFCGGHIQAEVWDAFFLVSTVFGKGNLKQAQAQIFHSVLKHHWKPPINLCNRNGVAPGEERAQQENWLHGWSLKGFYIDCWLSRRKNKCWLVVLISKTFKGGRFHRYFTLASVSSRRTVSKLQVKNSKI